METKPTSRIIGIQFDCTFGIQLESNCVPITQFSEKLNFWRS